MEISYLGHSSFKIKTKMAVVVTDPFDSSVGFKFPKTEADIVTVSHEHSDHNNIEGVTGTKKVITGPGEYEVMEVSIIGISSFHDNQKGEKRGKNTIYVYEAEGLRVAHLGDLGHDLPEGIIDQMGSVDILMIPVGGDYTIGPKEAASIVSNLEPTFVIPMHYQMSGLSQGTFSKLEGVEPFLKEVSLPSENMQKFSIKKSDIMEGQNTKVIVLERK